MDEKDIAILRNANIDYEDITDRFEGNEALYLKLAELFLSDPHMANIEAAFAEESHALKGVAGNLSLTSLHQLATRMNDLLKAHDEQAATELLPQLDDAYTQATQALRAVLGK